MAPTFEQLREFRELNVVNPENGARFRVSLQDWRECLWAIRVYPQDPRFPDKDNPYVKGHCMMDRHKIEDWLSRLKLQALPPIEK
jgi:hypothetical protein